MQNRARCLGLVLVYLVPACLVGLAGAPSAAADVVGSSAQVPADDGRHDFDWETGRWKTRLRRLANPLSHAGAPRWLEYEGTSTVRPVLDGRANLVELRVQGPAGEIEGASLRLYNPRTRQWSLNFASARDGTLTRPVFGGFRHGRGEFHGLEELDGRQVLVRFVISEITSDSARFEQAYSDDGGATWETNWIAIDTRLPAH